MGLGGAVQAQQLGQIGTGVQVTLGSLADEMSLTAKGHHIRLAEGLPLVRGGEQHFHGRHTAQPQRVQNGHAGVGVAAGVEHDAVHPSGGGLDLIGVILNKRWNIGIGRFNFSFNAVMFLASMATISLDMVIVSFIQVFVASATIEYALRMGSQRKMVYVVTDRGEALCEAIIAEGYGGATVLKGKGAYSGGDREIILTVTNNIMLRRLENLVFAIDDKALFIVENTFYVSGTRYPRKSII